MQKFQNRIKFKSFENSLISKYKYKWINIDIKLSDLLGIQICRID